MPDSRDGHPHDPLRAFLWGKRSSRRHTLAVDVTLRGTLKTVAAMSIDLSASGALLRVPVPDLAPKAASQGEVDPFLLAETHFRGPCLAHFRGPRVKTKAQMVRLDFRPDEPGFLYLGFRFKAPLDPKQLKRFGLTPSSVRAESHGLPSDMVSLRAANDPLICRLFNGGDRHRPMFEGNLLGCGDHTVCMLIDNGDIGLVGKRLGSHKVHLEVLDGDHVDWETPARLQAIGVPGRPRGALELGMVVDGEPSGTLRRKFSLHSAA